VVKNGFVKKFWILKNVSNNSIDENTMLVRKGGDAPDYKPQVVGKIEPKQTFKVSVKVGVRAAGDQKLTF